MNAQTMAGADFSNCGKYRYTLWRIWDKTLPKAMCIGLNPSTANADTNDATIRNLITMLSKLGYGGFYMMNCFAFITSKPELLQHNPMSDEWNINTLTIVASQCKDVIFSWGTFKVIKETGRDIELEEMFPNAKCFGFNRDGSPFHPMGMTYKKGALKSPKLFVYKSREAITK